MMETLASPPVGSSCLDDLARAFSESVCPSSSEATPAPGGLRIAFQPDDVRNGLGRLVLTVVELVRELLERQALRRIEAGSLTDLEIERLGTTFLQLSQQMEALKTVFGLEGQDLNLDLGPLGKLLDDPGQ
jgi:Gas vesicle protein K